MNDSLQYKISEKMQAKFETLQKYKLLEVCFMLFKNFTYNNEVASGLRLTKLGHSLLKSEYDTYKFPIEEGLHKKLLLILHKNMRWPYYLDTKNLYLYSDDDAMWLKMYGSIDKFAKGLE